MKKLTNEEIEFLSKKLESDLKWINSLSDSELPIFEVRKKMISSILLKLGGKHPFKVLLENNINI